jgi:hypothetical protein
MPDTKITALTALTAADPATDMFPVVDVSDTTMAASGTTKRISINNILACSPSATLASATISGDLTVRTNKLAVTSTGVGVNYTSPAVALHVGTTGATNKFCINTAVTSAGDIQLRRGAFIGFSNAADAANSEYLFANGGALEMGIGGTTAMTLNSTGLGVGGSPTAKLTILAGADGDVGFFRGGSTRQLQLGTSATAGYLNVDNASAGFELRVNGTARVYTDVSGNVGVSVAPSAWNNSYNVLEIGQNGSISGRTSANNQVDIVSNGFRNAGGTWVYKLATSNAAARYLVDGSVGGHFWYSGVAGTAPNTIAGFSTPAMTLDSSGNLILLSSNTPATLATNGQLTVNATSNTNLRFSYRGSDGTTRVANITLA